MTTEAQKIAIAEACGWKQDWINQGEVSENSLVWFAPNGGWVEVEDLPDFTSDLNAMHEAEKILCRQSRVDYCNWLAKVCKTEKDKMFATAAQRAEAFLRVIGKWDDAK